MSMNPSCQTCGIEDAEIVHCTACACPAAGKPTERTYTREEAESLMLKAWNLGHLNASASDEAYPAKAQRPIDIAFIFKVGP